MKKLKIEYDDNKFVDVTITKSNIHIEDSYKITSEKTMSKILTLIDEQVTYDDALDKRTRTSMIEEWRSHNLLYDWCILRTHTKDVDLESKPKWYFRFAYKIVSKLYITD